MMALNTSKPYRFNVEYNKDNFIKPPSIAAGPEVGEKQSDSE